MTLKLLLFVTISNAFATNAPLKHLHIIFRHGERAPTETYKNDPYINMTWQNGWGHLTNRGKYEMYELGLKLKELYSGFIPDYYFPDEVRVQSSYADRCLMSAEVLLAALFPPKDAQIWNENLLWQPIPIHYVPRTQDNLIVMRAPCKKYDDELKAVLESEPIRTINKENTKLFEYLSEHTGQKIDTIGAVEMLYNTLEIELLHNLTLPSWVRNVSFDHMKELAARTLAYFTENDFMKRMKGGVIVQQIIASVETKNPFVHLYSAHDTTLVNILRTLGVKSMLKPGFGASLIFEIYNSTQITILYRDDVKSDPKPIIVDNCETVCFLKDFKAALKPVLPLNWTQECEKGI